MILIRLMLFFFKPALKNDATAGQAKPTPLNLRSNHAAQIPGFARVGQKRLEALNNNRRRHTASGTHGNQRIPTTLALKFVQRRAHQDRTGRADGVA